MGSQIRSSKYATVSGLKVSCINYNGRRIMMNILRRIFLRSWLVVASFVISPGLSHAADNILYAASVGNMHQINLLEGTVSQAGGLPFATSAECPEWSRVFLWWFFQAVPGALEPSQ